jgi:hypothetical protein
MFPPRARDTRDQTAGDWVSHLKKDDWNVLGSGLQRFSFASTCCSNHVRAKLNKFICQASQARNIAVGPPFINVYCLVSTPAEVAQ